MGSELAVMTTSAVEVAPDSEQMQSRFLPVMSIAVAVRRFKDIQEIVQKLMEDQEDFGKIPGAKKPSLWKPGAEKLCNLFGLIPRYDEVKVIEDWTGEVHGSEPFFYYRVKCSLFRGDFLMGEGEGSCNSWESKYRFRSSERECPACGKAAIIKGKAEYGGGYICFAKKGGCGAKYPENDPAIGEQRVGKVANPEIFDLVNTVLKMANKRAHIAATLNATGASRFFTQDVEDIPQFDPTGSQAAADQVAERRIAEMKAAQKPQQSKPDTEAMQKAFAEIRTLIGDQAYFVLLGNNGYQKAEDIPDRAKGLAIYNEMQGYLKSMRKPQPAVKLAEEFTADLSDLSDLPDEMWAEGRN